MQQTHPLPETHPKQDKPLSEPQTSLAVEEAVVEEAVAEEADKTNHLARHPAGFLGHLAQETTRKVHLVGVINNLLPQN